LACSEHNQTLLSLTFSIARGERENQREKEREIETDREAVQALVPAGGGKMWHSDKMLINGYLSRERIEED